MEIVNPCAALLSNYEVYKILKETREDQKKIRNNIVRSNLRNLNTVAYETLKYFDSVSPCRFSSDATIPDFVASVKDYDLSKSELVQLINLRPSTHVELHAIIEECEERYSETQIASLLEIIRSSLHSNARARTSDSVCSYLSAGDELDLASLETALPNSTPLANEEDDMKDVMAIVRQRKRTKTVSECDDKDDEIEEEDDDDDDDDDPLYKVPTRTRKPAVLISDDEMDPGDKVDDSGGQNGGTITCDVLSDSKIKSLKTSKKDPKVKLKIKNMSKCVKEKKSTKSRGLGKQKRKVSISTDIEIRE